MGSFSWTKADLHNTKVANIVPGSKYRFLVPKEFGESFTDTYENYGDLLKSDEYPLGKYDAFELLAFWNKDLPFENGTVKDYLKYDENTNMTMPEQSRHTTHNRLIGISIGCYDEEIDALPYPLKFVSASYKGTYEDCEHRSYGDPKQGFFPLTWSGYHEVQFNSRYHSFTKSLSTLREMIPPATDGRSDERRAILCAIQALEMAITYESVIRKEASKQVTKELWRDER